MPQKVTTMGKKSASMPPPPDPYASASAQGRMNQEQAILESQLNRSNVASPWGTSTWELTPGTGSSRDPAAEAVYQQQLQEAQRQVALHEQAQSSSGGAHRGIHGAAWDAAEANLSALKAQGGAGIPAQYTQRITLSPAEQLAQSQGYQRGTASHDAIMRKYGEIQNQPGFGGLPQMVSGLNTEGLPELLSSLNLQGLPDISGGPGGYEASRRAVEEAMMSRLQPQFDRQRSSLQAEMANMGIPMGSEMYSTGFNELNQGLNDARMQAVLAGGQEQSRLFDMASRGRGQLTQEQLSNAGLASQARQQLIGEQLSNAGLAAQARQQGISEQQLPYQQIAQLLGGIPNPGQIPTSPMGNTQLAPGDFQGAQQISFAAQQQAAQLRAQQQAQMWGNITGLGTTAGVLGVAAMMSDERAKKDIEPYEGGLSEIMAMNPKQYEYDEGSIGEAQMGGGSQHGLIAQELAGIKPEAVVQDPASGMMGIQYMKLIPELIAAVQEQQVQINRKKGSKR